MKNKTDYRLYAKELRKTLDIKLLSKEFCRKIRNEEHYINAKNVMLFYPAEFEIDLRELFNDDKNFYLPKVFEDKLLVCPLSEKLEKSKFNIMEPCSEPIEPELLDIIIVPALMADKNGYRLGYGGGFYDRFLPLCKNAFKIVVVPKELFIAKLPHDEFDVKVDKVLFM